MAEALVIGAGYLGLRVARVWSRHGMSVHVTTRSTLFQPEGLRTIVCDVLDPPIDALPAVDLVLYAVGFDRTSGSALYDVYVTGLERVLAVLPVPRRFLYVSSTGVYGDCGGAWLDETTPPEPMDESGRICLEAERVLEKSASQRGIATVVLRLAGLYGPGRLIGAERLRAGAAIAADPDVYLNLIHVEDAARIVAAAAARDHPSRLYNVADGQPVPRRQFYAYLAERLNAPPPVFDASAAGRQRGNRRVRNERMRQELLADLRYPNYRAGVDAILSNWSD